MWWIRRCPRCRGRRPCVRDRGWRSSVARAGPGLVDSIERATRPARQPTTDNPAEPPATMPIYEYTCAGCRRKVSVFQRSVSATAAPRCPECGSSDLARLISTFAFHRGMPDFDDGASFDEAAFMDGIDENDPQS